MALADNLVAYWKLDGGSTADSTANAYNLTNTGASSVAGKIVDGFSFNGTSNYMTAASNSNFNSKVFSISFWFKTTSTALIRPISKEWNGDFRKYGFLFNGYWNGSTTITSNKTISMFIGTSSGFQSNVYFTTTNSNDGNWHHVAVTFNYGVMAMYYDGVLKYSNTFSDTMPASNSAMLHVGCGYSATRYGYFPGTLDEIGFWTKELTSTEVTDLYNSGLGISYPFSGGGPTPNFFPFLLAHAT